MTREALQELVDSFHPGSPVFSEHGVRQIGRTVSAELRQRNDGEWEVVGQADIDVPPGETAATTARWLQRAWSIAVLERGDDAPPEPVVTVGLDTLAFTDSELQQARMAFQDVSVSTYVTWYHQFADAPQAAVVVDIARNLLSIVPPEVWRHLFDKLVDVVLSLVFREPPRSTPITLRVRSQNLRIDLEVPVDADPKMVKETLRGVEAMLHPRADEGRTERGTE
jgi:hypothetical protein